MPQDKKKSDRRERLAAARDRRRGESGGGGGGSRSSYTQRDLPKLPPPAPASAKAERRLSSRTVKDSIVKLRKEVNPSLNPEIATKFLLARKFDVGRAAELYKNYMEAIEEHKFRNVSLNDVLPELKTEKMYIPGTRDRNGAHLFVINAKEHVPADSNPVDTLKLAFYMGETIISSESAQKRGITIVVNLEGVGWSNYDHSFHTKTVQFFQDTIPARIKTILLLNAPWWINMLMRMVTPFMKQKMRDRIRICSDLTEFVNEDQLPRDLGGSVDYNHAMWIVDQMKQEKKGFRAGYIPSGRGGGGSSSSSSHRRNGSRH